MTCFDYIPQGCYGCYFCVHVLLISAYLFIVGKVEVVYFTTLVMVNMFVDPSAAGLPSLFEQI